MFERVERPGVVGSDFAVLVDVDLGEEGLVARAPGLVVSSLLDGGDVAVQAEGLVQVRLGFGVTAVAGGDPMADLFQLGADAVLFA